MTLIELSEQAFSDFLHELLTVRGADSTGRARVVRGDLAGWQRWEPAIQSLCSGREIYGPGVRQTLVDSTGAPLDLHRGFLLDDDLDEMRHFFDRAGYLHLKGVFSPQEVAQYGAAIESARQRTTRDDPTTWWSVTADGEDVVTRMNYLGRHSSLLAALAHDPRLERCAQIAGRELRVCDDRLDGPMVFIKNSNVVKGNGNLGWHIDPALGGGPVICPFIQVGIQLDHANPVNGQLLVLAGSHRYTKHALGWGDEKDLPAVALVTDPGDITIHDAYALHTTPPPTGDAAGRRVLYYKFAEQKTFNWIPAGYHYNDGLFQTGAQYQAVTDAYTPEDAST
ncbi:phytanoyl-CoA dioxygenase family protein [Mycobacterium sp. CVI_P3]|uniref:phytanoyl-CoA dioxygenase family protein n=1 Tax=Mycobacterium pinniadriaticum TaxID=2994102 RepID=UPI002248A798|nr:phytanoyl-CoA dioxygenase family protein [Mycobacterium pinniadriaticum]MCX2932418.1 phytanoyl-CoA dioxygenase family protein [Mycobacterium pinniadriaticum]